MFGSEARDGDLEVLLFHIQHGMFYFAGFEVLAPVVSYSPVRKTPEERTVQLVRVHEAFSQVESRTVLFGPGVQSGVFQKPLRTV